MYVLVVSGSRTWTDDRPIRRVLYPLIGKKIMVRHGGCRGVDMLADAVAREFGFEVDVMAADWYLYGRSAGPRRNRAMLDKEPHPKFALLFHHRIERSKGTRDMLKAVLERGLRFRLVTG